MKFVHICAPVPPEKCSAGVDSNGLSIVTESFREVWIIAEHKVGRRLRLMSTAALVRLSTLSNNI